jgi:hypothetical protein
MTFILGFSRCCAVGTSRDRLVHARFDLRLNCSCCVERRYSSVANLSSSIVSFSRLIYADFLLTELSAIRLATATTRSLGATGLAMWAW